MKCLADTSGSLEIKPFDLSIRIESSLSNLGIGSSRLGKLGQQAREELGILRNVLLLRSMRVCKFHKVGSKNGLDQIKSRGAQVFSLVDEVSRHRR